MYWILTHPWVSVAIALVGVGGAILVNTRINMSQRKTHPTPKRRTVNVQPKVKSNEPLLIRLPKLG